jgi:ACT domain-containing protein
MGAMRIVMTIVGLDKVGIIAKASTLLAENQVNILNINQNITDTFFNMVLIGDMEKATISLEELKKKAAALGDEIGLQIRVQSEEIFTAMHRI